VKPDVLDRIVENGSIGIKAAPARLEPAVPDLREKYPNQSDDERLLRFMFAGNQVDEMHAAGPLQTDYAFKNKAQRLLEAALTSKRQRYISVADGEVKLEAVRRT
jgi:oxaloacetate decarboxylase alpha subunit